MLPHTINHSLCPRAGRGGGFILSVKKGMLIAAAAVFACVVLLSLCFSSVAAGMSGSALFTVVLDAGHGGVDGGVVGKTTGVKESEINLSLVYALKEDFENAGFKVVLTRTDEGGLYGLPTKGFKRRDMQKRREIIEEASPAVMLSVHQNYFPSDPSRRGGQAFYRMGSASGQKLAQSIQAELNTLSQREHSALTGDYYMLECTNFTSVIVECGFLSNAEDEALLTDPSYREKLANAIFCGTLAFLS